MFKVPFIFGHSISFTVLTMLQVQENDNPRQIGGEAHLGNSQDTDAWIITHNYQLAGLKA